MVIGDAIVLTEYFLRNGRDFYSLFYWTQTLATDSGKVIWCRFVIDTAEYDKAHVLNS